VNSIRKVAGLNADRLDGWHERAFARKLCHTGPNSYVEAQTDCTRIATYQAPLTDTGYDTPSGHDAPGGVVQCGFGYAVSGGYQLGASATPDEVVASHGFAWRYQNTAWGVRLQPNPAHGGTVAPGGFVYVTCVGPHAGT
jgi:hypothetical protein